MRSIRTRLMAILFATTGLVWLSAVGWIYLSTQSEVERVLDARLVEAARMVDSLIADHRIEVAMAADAASDIALPFATAPDYERQLSCQIWSLSGALVGRSESAPEERLAEGGAGFSETRIDGETWRVYVVDNAGLGLRVMVGDNLRVRDRLVNDVVLGLLLPAGLVLPLAGGLIWFSVRRGLAPLDAMAGMLAARPAEDLRPIELDTVPPDELRPAVSALNGLFRRVHEARERERSFTAYAAHELKTPLAGLKTQAQVALASDDPAVTRQALGQIAGGVDRASRLVRQLLDLARIDASDPSAGHVPVDLSALASAAVDECRFSAAQRSVALRTETLPGALGLGEPTLVAVALRNVLENAILHAGTEGSVDIRVVRRGGDVAIEVADTGPGMGDEEIAKATERFFRGRAETATGSGLGLAIVHTVMERSRGHLDIRNRPGGGLLVTLVLPAAGTPG